MNWRGCTGRRAFSPKRIPNQVRNSRTKSATSIVPHKLCLNERNKSCALVSSTLGRDRRKVASFLPRWSTQPRPSRFPAGRVACHVLLVSSLSTPAMDVDYVDLEDYPEPDIARRLLRRATEEVQAIEEWPTRDDNDAEDEDVSSPLYQYLVRHGMMVDFTNFTSLQVEAIWRQYHSVMAAERHRGAPPRSTAMDHLLCYLIWLKTAQNESILGETFDIKGTRFEDNLNRARGSLFTALAAKWWAKRPRPVLQEDNPYPAVGIIVDGHTTERCVPKMSFEQAKVWFDGHHHIYGYKNEVAVHATAPYYCLFVSPHVPGSKHDYELHKEYVVEYFEYLKVTPQEALHMPARWRGEYWPVLADKGYVGPAEDTAPVRRIVPKRGKLVDAREEEDNKAINARRVPVEQFLGRLVKLWGVFRGTWRWDESHFDEDFYLACLLTNEHIANNTLVEDDQIFYEKWIDRRRNGALEKERRQKAIVRRSKNKAKERFRELNARRDAQQHNIDHV